MKKTILQIEIPYEIAEEIEKDRIEFQVESTERFIESMLIARKGIYNYPKFWRECFRLRPEKKIIDENKPEE